jgi:cytochrome P450
MEARIRERREDPTGDGLSRILAKAAPDGSRIDDHGAALELHHIFLAGYIVFAELAGMVMRLAAAPEVLEALRVEVEGQDDSLAALMAAGLLDRVVLETKRITPMLPIIFGKARQDIRFEQRRIPKGWLVCLGLTASHKLADVFADPERFDPDRFAPGRAEHEAPHAYAPQGPGPDNGHRCAGVDYSSLIMKAFAIELLRNYRFELPEQDLRYDLALIPPEPRSGLIVQLSREASG